MFKFFCVLLFSTSIIHPSASNIQSPTTAEDYALDRPQQDSLVCSFSSMSLQEQARIISSGSIERDSQPNGGIVIRIPEDDIRAEETRQQQAIIVEREREQTRMAQQQAEMAQREIEDEKDLCRQKALVMSCCVVLLAGMSTLLALTLPSLPK